MPDYADAAAKQFEAAWQRIQNRAADIFAEAMQQRGSIGVDGVLDMLDELDVRALVSELAAPEIERLATRYTEGLKLLSPYGEISGATLERLLASEIEVYVGRVGASANELHRLIARSVVTNASETQFAKDLLQTGLQPHQANALANDSLRKYQRAVKDHMAQTAPPDKLYIYEGPNDERTSDECLEMLAAGALTYEQIESQFPGSFASGGHFGCRHSWNPLVRERQKRDFDILPGAA